MTPIPLIAFDWTPLIGDEKSLIKNALASPHDACDMGN